MPIPLLALGAYMLVGAGISAVWAVAEGRPVTWRTLAIGAAGGLVGGGIGGALLARTSSVILSGAVGGGAGSGTSQVVENALEGRPLTENVARATAVGTVVGGVAAPLIPAATNVGRNVARRLGGAVDDVRPGPSGSGAGLADDARPPAPADRRAGNPTVADDARPVNPASEAMPPPALAPPVRTVPTDSVRFSQRTAGGNGRADGLRESMRRNGWRGDPVDVVETPTGLTTIDNTRVAVARELGIETIPVRVRGWNEPLPPSMLRQGSKRPRFGEDARTWGDALRYRTASQGRQNGAPFPQDGSTVPPRLPAPSETRGLTGAVGGE
jgi:hypothetical protein